MRSFVEDVDETDISSSDEAMQQKGSEEPSLEDNGTSDSLV